MPARGSSARPQDDDAFSSGDIAVNGGVAAGTLADFADALNLEPEAFEEALVKSPIEPINDTAEPKDPERDYNRHTDPERRSLAFSVSDLRKFAALVGAGEALSDES